MKLVLVWCAISFTVAVAEQYQPPPGFERLFNGRKLEGWQGREHVDPESFRNLPESQRKILQEKADADFHQHWRVENGELVNDGQGVFCTTIEKFTDFELLLDWKMVEPGTDSGVYLRGTPQVQIWDIHDESKREHGAHLGSGGLWNNDAGSPGKDPLVVADRPIGQWNTLRIRLVADRVTVHLNGQLVVDDSVLQNFWDRQQPLYGSGPIQLQTHGGEMHFRNIFIRRLNQEATDSVSSTSTTCWEQYVETIPGTDTDFTMLPLAGGDFTMGSPDEEPERSVDEGPMIKIRVAPFWMGECEVTWEEYRHFMKLCNTFERFDDLGIRQINEENQVDAITAPSKLYDPSFTYVTGDDPSQPAVSMTQYAAKQYTKWLSLITGRFYRLPTEAEWEYACRAGSSTAYSFGNDASMLDQYAWYYDNSDEGLTGKVGQKKPNAWGLHDMHGNAAEWVLDQFHDRWYSHFMGHTVSSDDVIAWPTALYPRVLRGGSWDSEADQCRCGKRIASSKEWKSYDPNVPKSPWWFASEEGQTVGFRIVRPQQPPPRAEWNRYWDADIPKIRKDADRRIDQEGRGERGWADPELPDAVKKLQADAAR